MRRLLVLLLLLALTGCALLRRDETVREVFPQGSAEEWEGAIEVGEEWAR